MPNVVGKTQDEARSALDDFKVTVIPKEDDEAEPGTVLAQDPAARGRAARGSTVRLTVAIEPKQIDVPDVVGRSQNTATKTLSGRRLRGVGRGRGGRHDRVRTARSSSSRPRRTAARSTAARR